MTKIVIEIKDCSGCPYHKSSPYPTSDSFECPEYWWCSMDDKTCDGNDERYRQYVMKDKSLKKLRKIAGYVEWCPCIAK